MVEIRHLPGAAAAHPHSSRRLPATDQVRAVGGFCVRGRGRPALCGDHHLRAPAGGDAEQPGADQARFPRRARFHSPGRVDIDRDGLCLRRALQRPEHGAHPVHPPQHRRRRPDRGGAHPAHPARDVPPGVYELRRLDRRFRAVGPPQGAPAGDHELGLPGAPGRGHPRYVAALPVLLRTTPESQANGGVWSRASHGARGRDQSRYRPTRRPPRRSPSRCACRPAPSNATIPGSWSGAPAVPACVVVGGPPRSPRLRSGSLGSPSGHAKPND